MGQGAGYRLPGTGSEPDLGEGRGQGLEVESARGE